MMPETAMGEAFNEVIDEELASDAGQSCPLPEGDYAVVEVMGHRRYVGRVAEVLQYGKAMCGVEIVFRDGLLDQVLIGGGSIFAVTPCSRESAWASRARHAWQLPKPSADAVTPPAVLEQRDIAKPALLERVQSDFLDGDDPDDDGSYGGDY